MSEQQGGQNEQKSEKRESSPAMQTMSCLLHMYALLSTNVIGVSIILKPCCMAR